MTQQFQFGLDTFGDNTLKPDGSLLTHVEVIRDVIEEGVHADALGIDAFGVGEHHRPDFAVSAPEVVLAAVAGRSRRIRLGSAVPCSPRTIRSACSSVSRRSTPLRTGALR